MIEQQFIENEEPGDPFKVSDADTMMNYINKDAAELPFATVFSKPGCPFCVKAKEMLTAKAVLNLKRSSWVKASATAVCVP